MTETKEKTKTAKSKVKKNKAEAKPAPEPVELTSGKVAVGPTVEIQCQWKGENGNSGKRCPNKRTIKPQDVFQVKFCLEHQKKNRSARIKARRQAKAAERKAAQAAA